MKRLRPASGILAIGVAFLFPIGVSAQVSKLNDLAAETANKLKSIKPHLVAVADLQPLDGKSSPQGHYFAELLSVTLQERGKKKFTVANHDHFDADLKKLNIEPGNLAPGETLQKAAPNVGADVLVTGTLERREDTYVIRLLPVRIADQRALSPISQTLVVSDFLESFVTPFPADVIRRGDKSFAGITMPTCAYCPDPHYSDLARSNRTQGVSVWEVLIAADGSAEQMRPVKLLGDGLDEQAYNAIRTWRFHPSTRKSDGTPVAVITPIEVSFRLY